MGLLKCTAQHDLAASLAQESRQKPLGTELQTQLPLAFPLSNSCELCKQLHNVHQCFKRSLVKHWEEAPSWFHHRSEHLSTHALFLILAQTCCAASTKALNLCGLDSQRGLSHLCPNFLKPHVAPTASTFLRPKSH